MRHAVPFVSGAPNSRPNNCLKLYYLNKTRMWHAAPCAALIQPHSSTMHVRTTGASSALYKVIYQVRLTQ